MKITFYLTDEKTVTNRTVKITAAIEGTINGETRDQIEERCLATAKSLFPDNQWAFARFTYNSNGLTFSVTASTRIDSSLNEQLDEKAKLISTSDTKLTISNIDPSIPSHDMRNAESELRVHLIALAEAEAKILGGTINRVTFEPSYGMNSVVSNSGRADFKGTYAAAGAAPQLGHTEKITMTATIVVSV